MVFIACEQLASQVERIGFSMQPYKCTTWSPWGFLVISLHQLCLTSDGLKVLGIQCNPLIHIIKDSILEDVKRIDVFPKMSDLQVPFEIIIRCFI
jgi:hypothetical protein